VITTALVGTHVAEGEKAKDCIMNTKQESIRELFIEELNEVTGGARKRRCPGGGGASTEAVGEEDGGGTMTTLALGEEGGSGDGGVSTRAMGEEGGTVTTFALGEEGGFF
jgi:hypothetical protein